MGCIKYRYFFAVMACAGMAIIYGMKVNLSVAMVAMVNHTALAEQNKHDNSIHGSTLHGGNDGQIEDDNDDALVCKIQNSTKTTTVDTEDGPLVWAETQQGLILSSYFWGYFITQIPGGRLAEITSAKWVFFFATFLNVFGCLLSPVISTLSPYGLIVLRIIQGLGGGVTFPAMNVLITKWSPSDERSSITAMVLGGCSLGTVISIPSAGLIARLLSWEWIFYIHGGLSAIWLLFWALFVTDTPRENKFISQDECNSIEGNQTISTSKKLKVPCVDIFKSVPVWTIIVCHTLNNVGWYMLLVELPLFLRSGLGISIAENSILSSVPFLCNWLFSILYGNRLDWLRKKKCLSTTWARKMSVGVSSLIPAICFVGVCLSTCDKTLVMMFMVIATTFYGAMYSGIFSNHADIASNYSGVLMGISNMAATVPGFIIPTLVGVMTHGIVGLDPWHTLFYGTAAILVAKCIIFFIFGTSEEQKWNRGHEIVKQSNGETEMS